MTAVRQNKNNLYIIGEKEFDPQGIFENGQSFRWTKKRNKYTLVVGQYLASISLLSKAGKTRLAQEGILEKDEIPKPVILLENGGNLEDYHQFWYHYFDMGTDYEALREMLSQKDLFLKAATQYGAGFRILNQDLFEMIITFILSANNNIPRIKNNLQIISELAGGKRISPTGEAYYPFPTPSALASIHTDDLRKLAKVGYRAPYVIGAATMIAQGELELAAISSMDYEAAHSYLQKLPGVGPKVADCILLFGNQRTTAFPVDTWVIKLMNSFYLPDEKNNKKIKTFGQEYFGQYAGLAQQYLFHYARNHKINTKNK